MGWFEGMLGGYQKRHYDLEAEQLRQAELRNQRESKIFEALLTSPDDEIKALAATGLLSSAQGPKRKGGFQGWLGQMETNPMLDRIKGLIGTSKTTTIPGLPSQQMQGYLPTPPGESMALPSTSPTEIGSPPPTPQATMPAPDLTPPPEQPQAEAAPAALPPDVGTPPPEPTMAVGGTPEQPELRFEAEPVTVTGTPGMAEPVPEVGAPPPAPASAFTTRYDSGAGAGRTETTPRQIFQSPEGQQRLNRIAQSQGDVEGDYAGLIAAGIPPDEARKIVAEAMRRKVGGGGVVGQSYAEGNVVPDPDSPTGFSQDLYLRSDPRVRMRIPAQPPGAVKLGNALEEAAGQLGHASAAAARAKGPEVFKAVSDLATKIANERSASEVTAKGGAAATVPRTIEQKADDENGMRTEWNAISAKVRDASSSVAQMKAAARELELNPRTLEGAAEAITVLWERSLDPNSVVREAEANRPAQFSGLWQRIEGAVARFKKGGAPVTQEEMLDYVDLAETIQKAAEASIKDHRDNYIRIALERGLNPANVVVGYQKPATPGGGVTPPPGGAGGAGGAGGTTVPGATAPGGDVYETRPDGVYKNGVLFLPAG